MSLAQRWYNRHCERSEAIHLTPDDVKEIILQQAIYCGVPAANHAVKEASAVVGELGLLKG